MNIVYPLFFLISFSARAYVQVNPVRFHVKETKFSHFTVRNTQSKSVKVEIESRYFKMTPDGKMAEEKGTPSDELKKVLFTPKNIVLGPGEKQVIRFFVKDELKGAELRTYAYILTEIQDDSKDGGSSPSPAQVLTLTPKVAIAVPVIYRLKTDKNNIEFGPEDLRQVTDGCLISTEWKNKTHSSYVNLEALDKNDKNIFVVNGVSNFLPNYQWKQLMSKVKCSDVKKIKIFDVDNDVYVVSREIKP